MDDLTGKIIAITGATDGLGKAVAMDMAEKGATILLHGRDPEKGQEVLQEIRTRTGNDKHTYYNADFSSLAEVGALAGRILAENSRLDLLINNAGIGGGEKENIRQTGKDGFELRFTVNYLSSFLLTMRLLPLLRTSAPSKIVNVSSAAQKEIDFSDVMLERNYDPSRAYGQSKLAQVMFTFDLAAQLKDTGITVNCLHPASMMDTPMVREGGGQPKTPVSEGVDTVEYVATSPAAASATGVYFDRRKPAKATSQAYNPEARQQLRALSIKLTAESFT